MFPKVAQTLAKLNKIETDSYSFEQIKFELNNPDHLNYSTWGQFKQNWKLFYSPLLLPTNKSCKNFYSCSIFQVLQYIQAIDI